MALDSRDLSGPQLRYSREEGTEVLTRALELARQLEELLEDTRSIGGMSVAPPASEAAEPAEAAPSLRAASLPHSTRMARAMAASLVDELEVLVRPARRTASSA